MNSRYRGSRFIDFNNGQVILDPESFVEQTAKPWSLDQKIDFFECRVDVWQFGVAVEMLKLIEAAKGSSAWCHGAYGLLSVITSYFEMVGKVLNPDSSARGSSSRDFNFGFGDVYPDFVHEQRHLAGVSGYSDTAVPYVARYRDLMRNGMYHLGYPKKNFLIHNSPNIETDVKVFHIRDKEGGQTLVGVAYLLNPHRVTRTLVDHFAGFTARLRVAGNPDLRRKFEEFFEDFHAAE